MKQAPDRNPSRSSKRALLELLGALAQLERVEAHVDAAAHASKMRDAHVLVELVKSGTANVRTAIERMLGRVYAATAGMEGE